MRAREFVGVVGHIGQHVCCTAAMSQPRPQLFASLIQSSFGDTSHRNFEAVVMLANSELWHYWRDNTAAGNQTWKKGGPIFSGAGRWGAATPGPPTKRL